MDKKAVVLLSGGIDSTTCLATAIEEFGVEDVLALSIYYGQKHSNELKHARDVAEYYGVDFIEHQITGVFDYSDCTLLQGRGEVAHGSYADQHKATEEGPVDTYVPFRNGIFLSHATAIAISVGAHWLYYGAHADDAVGNAYPDCSERFASNMHIAIFHGSGWQVEMRTPFIRCNKAAVVAEGLRLNAPYHLTWSCYEGGDRPCGKCGTCIDRQKAFEANGVADPAMN